MAQCKLFRIFLISVALLIACVVGIATLLTAPSRTPTVGVNDINGPDNVRGKDIISEEPEGFEGETLTKKTEKVLDEIIRETEIRSILAQYTPISILNDTNTAQGMAYNWIVHVDDMKLSGESANLPQRYALATFYFSTGGPDHWSNGDTWVTHVHECSWSDLSLSGHKTGVNSCDAGNNVLTVELSNNQMLGSIPPEIGLLTTIRVLDVQNNMLTGNIPKTIGDMEKLNEVFLNDNKLTGTIPEELGKLISLQVLLLQFNELEGYIPGELCMLQTRKNLYNFWTDCLGDDEQNLADVICSCCTYCCNGLDRCEEP